MKENSSSSFGRDLEKSPLMEIQTRKELEKEENIEREQLEDQRIDQDTQYYYGDTPR